MNEVIQLIGKMQSKGKGSTVGPAKLPNGKSVSSDHIGKLIDDLEKVIAFWEKDDFGITPLVRVTYISTVAKSNRLSKLLLESSTCSLNKQIVGAEFTDEQNPRHIITYKVSVNSLKRSLILLQHVHDEVTKYFNGKISSVDVDKVNSGDRCVKNPYLKKSIFTGIIKDCYYTDGFSVKEAESGKITENQLVTIYDTGLDYDELVRKIGRDFRPSDKFDKLTWVLTPEQFALVNSIAPYLISMNMKDIAEYPAVERCNAVKSDITIPDPSDEPTIGVIDTLFCKDVYFSKWVDYHQCLDEDIIDDEDFNHGTEVSSIIVDGPSLNRELDDGCGRFKVRHFGVSKDKRTSSLEILRKIQTIVETNRDIKVWNLSLGSNLPVSSNFISPEAAILDQLQYEYDVLFIVAGTNNKNEDDTYPPIGSPADSLNAITVNCSDFGNKAVHYARRGPVLRFFNKPDVSTFGGVREDRIQVYGPRGFRKVYGTSYAAPWITRKAAYLIHVMNLTKEAAKALIIDAAAGWNTDISNITLLGYGNVPRRIEDIINTQDDEIRFFINSTSIDYDTYTSNIPVPCTKKGFPFRFRVTMCYTPRCHRNQGVDYTDTDLDIHFGRYKGTRMSSINNNEQGEPVCLNLPEGKARSQFRKWDNVKRVCEGLIDNPRHKQLSTDNSLFWGMSIKAVERLDDKPGRGMPFCAVVTMKSIDNVNRYGQFKQLCATSHIWNVIPLDQKVMVETYHVSEEEAVFEN